jgi:hypothetical protein
MMILLGAWCAPGATAGSAAVKSSVKSGAVVKAGRLAGIVRRSDSLVIVKGVRVEECTRGWKEVTRTTYTDEEGRFEITNLPKRKIHYLRLTMEGATPGFVKVKIDRGKSLVPTKDLTLVIAESV